MSLCAGGIRDLREETLLSWLEGGLVQDGQFVCLLSVRSSPISLFFVSHLSLLAAGVFRTHLLELFIYNFQRSMSRLEQR